MRKESKIRFLTRNILIFHFFSITTTRNILDKIVPDSKVDSMGFSQVPGGISSKFKLRWFPK